MKTLGAQADFKLSSSFIANDHSFFVRFDGKDLDFYISGMSHIMPYESHLFSTLDAKIWKYIKQSLKKIKEAIERFEPDLIHTHHLWIVSAFTKKIAKDIPMVTKDRLQNYLIFCFQNTQSFKGVLKQFRSSNLVTIPKPRKTGRLDEQISYVYSAIFL